MESLICKFNQFGFCKFEKTCRKRHEDLICENKECDLTICEKRHPKPCIFFSKYKQCKFGTYCKYSHSDEKELRFKMLFTKIESLEESIAKRDKVIVEMRERLVALKNISVNKAKYNTTHTEDTFENGNNKEVNIMSDVTSCECVECEKTFKSNNELSLHMKTHETIEQIDGNATVLDEKEQCTQLLSSYVYHYCDLCNYQSSCEKSLIIHTEKIHKNPKPKKKKQKRPAKMPRLLFYSFFI